MRYTKSGIPVVDAVFANRYGRDLPRRFEERVGNRWRYTFDKALDEYTLDLATIAGKIHPSDDTQSIRASIREVMLGRRIVEGALKDFILYKRERDSYVLPMVTSDAKSKAYNALRNNRDEFFRTISEENTHLARVLIDAAGDFAFSSRGREGVQGRVISGGCIAYNLLEFQGMRNGEFGIEEAVLNS